jgi:hypothetical protein
MIAVVGAAAVDVVARRERFLAGTSNPAALRWAPGGVGYRIWRRLPAPRLLLSAVGDDPAGRWLEERIGVKAERRQGRDRSARGTASRPRQVVRSDARLLRLPRFATACYCAFMESGRLLYGAADMAVIEQGLTLARLRPFLPPLGPGDLLVLEANLSPPLVEVLLRRYARRTRAVFEAVSVEKLLRHEPGLRDLYLLSVNQEEAAALRARVAPRARGEQWVARFLRERHIAHLLVPRGRRGASLHTLETGGRVRTVSFAPARVVRASDSTGAGDRLLAAVLARVAGGVPPQQALPRAMREIEKALEEGNL